MEDPGLLGHTGTFNPIINMKTAAVIGAFCLISGTEQDGYRGSFSQK